MPLRQEIQKLYQTISTEQILVHSGTQEAIFNCMNCLLESTDNIIVQFPAYQSLFQIAESLGCEIKLWESSATNNWQLDFEILNTLVTPQTKMIILNLPHNPTGYTFSQSQLQQLIEFARKNNIYIFLDEVYRFSEHTDSDRLPAISDLYEKGISLGVMSKSFGLAGLRIGWIACKDKALMEKLAQFKEYTSICNSAPSEFLAEQALKQKEQILNRNVKLAKTNLKLIEDLFSQWHDYFSFLAPKAGCIGFPSINFAIDAEKFCIELQQQKSVLLLPGKYFNYHKSQSNFNQHFRIGFGRKNLPEALCRLNVFLKEKFC